jgi:8-oxo-dGTP pyrophosphatase MutT (NUDIX family)
VTTGAAAIVFGAETPEQACVREAREETGADIVVGELVGRYGLENGFEAYAFVCELASGTPSLQPTGELTEVCWLTPADIPQPQSNILHYALPDALAGKRGVQLDALPRVS